MCRCNSVWTYFLIRNGWLRRPRSAALPVVCLMVYYLCHVYACIVVFNICQILVGVEPEFTATPCKVMEVGFGESHSVFAGVLSKTKENSLDVLKVKLTKGPKFQAG